MICTHLLVKKEPYKVSVEYWLSKQRGRYIYTIAGVLGAKALHCKWDAYDVGTLKITYEIHATESSPTWSKGNLYYVLCLQFNNIFHAHP